MMFAWKMCTLVFLGRGLRIDVEVCLETFWQGTSGGVMWSGLGPCHL